MDASSRFIAFMGPTGTGKSSFISELAPGAAAVGHGLSSCTGEVILIETVIDGIPCTLIDTPGFDDTEKSDTATLRLISNYLEVAHGAGQKLRGVIYLHRITDNRVGGVSAKNIRLFRAICGEDALKNVILCTTMWDKANRHEDDRIDAEHREGELKKEFWRPMIEAGSTVARHDKTRESALNIVRLLIGREPVTLQLPEERKNDVPLLDTAAGMQLREELRVLREQHIREMNALREEMARDSGATMQELQTELMHEISWLYEARNEQGMEIERLHEVQQEQMSLIAAQGAEISRLQQELERRRGLWRSYDGNGDEWL